MADITAKYRKLKKAYRALAAENDALKRLLTTKVKQKKAPAKAPAKKKTKAANKK